jgi:hypothetical protein
MQNLKDKHSSAIIVIKVGYRIGEADFGVTYRHSLSAAAGRLRRLGTACPRRRDR